MQTRRGAVELPTPIQEPQYQSVKGNSRVRTIAVDHHQSLRRSGPLPPVATTVVSRKADQRVALAWCEICVAGGAWCYRVHPSLPCLGCPKERYLIRDYPYEAHRSRHEASKAVLDRTCARRLLSCFLSSVVYSGVRMYRTAQAYHVM